jgi:hypothetical protein
MSDTVIPLNRVPDKKEALEIVRRLVTEEKIALSRHTQLRMSQRKVSYHQIINCLKKGRITEGPFQVKNGYEMRFERGTAGDWLRVVLCLRFKQDMLIISVIN